MTYRPPMTNPAPGIEARTRLDGTRCYRATVYDKATRKRHRKTFDKLMHAKRWKRDAEQQLQAGASLKRTGPTLQQACDEWVLLARRGVIRTRSGATYKPSAVRGYEQAMRLRVLEDFGNWRLGEIGRTDLQCLIEKLIAQDDAASTVHTAINPVRRIYQRAISLGHVKTNPTTGLQMPAITRRPKWIPPVTLCLDLLDALPVRDRCVWATAMFAGLRRGELAGLRGQDLDLANGLIHVRRGWDDLEGEILPKSKSGARKVPIVALLRDHLADHAAAVGEKRPGHVLGHINDIRPLYARSHDVWKAAGLRTVTFHDCRHAAASFFIAAGGNAKAISTVLGHASINTTFDIYGHLLPGSEDELAKLTDRYFETQILQRAAPRIVPSTAAAQ